MWAFAQSRAEEARAEAREGGAAESVGEVQGAGAARRCAQCACRVCDGGPRRSTDALPLRCGELVTITMLPVRGGCGIVVAAGCASQRFVWTGATRAVAFALRAGADAAPGVAHACTARIVAGARVRTLVFSVMVTASGAAVGEGAAPAWRPGRLLADLPDPPRIHERELALGRVLASGHHGDVMGARWGKLDVRRRARARVCASSHESAWGRGRRWS